MKKSNQTKLTKMTISFGADVIIEQDEENLIEPRTPRTERAGREMQNQAVSSNAHVVSTSDEVSESNGDTLEHHGDVRVVVTDSREKIRGTTSSSASSSVLNRDHYGSNESAKPIQVPGAKKLSVVTRVSSPPAGQSDTALQSPKPSLVKKKTFASANSQVRAFQKAGTKRQLRSPEPI